MGRTGAITMTTHELDRLQIIHATAPKVDWVAMVFNAQPARWAFFIAEPV